MIDLASPDLSLPAGSVKEIKDLEHLIFSGCPE
jgi:hypothetical protein